VFHNGSLIPWEHRGERGREGEEWERREEERRNIVWRGMRSLIDSSYLVE
jgi:hypothetical protein